MKPKYKILNGLCVPVTTPDDYFEQSATQWLEKQKVLRLVARRARSEAINRICARYELESDEFYTAEQKAERILATTK